jgi:hypothetical protein
MNKLIFTATLMTMLGLAGCATTDQPDEPTVAVADAGKIKLRNQESVTGSRIPGNRSASVSATASSDAQKDMRDRVAPYSHKN